MMPKEDVLRLRKQAGDSAVFNNLLQSDPKFKEGADRVQSLNPNMSGFERAKFPTAMIDLYYGIEGGKPDPETSTMAINATRNAPVDEQTEEESALDQLTGNPLGFAGQTLANVPGSAWNLGKGIFNAVTHPIQTGTALVQAGVGGAANTIETIANLAGVKNPEDIFDLQSEEVASAIGDFYVQRYGSVEAAAMTLREDPVGFMSDVATVISGVGGAIKGGATLAGSVTGAATKTTTALSATGKAIRAVQGFGDDILRVGIKMEPVVIAGKGVYMAGRGVRSALSAGGNAERLVDSAIKLNPNQIRNFMKPNVGGGETPAQFLLRKGLSGTREGIMDDLDKLWRKSKDVVDGELGKVRETFDLIDDAPDVFKALSEIQETAAKFGLDDELKFVNDLIKKERVTLSDINAVKRQMDDLYTLYSRSNDPTASLIAERLRRIRDGIKGFVEETAERKGLKDIRVLNKDTQLSRELLKDMEQSAVGRYPSNIISMGDFLTGGVGGALVGYDPILTAGIVISRRVLGSTLFKTTLAKYLNRLSADEIGKMVKVMAGGRHTKETIRITRKVIAQTAEDVKNKRVGHTENTLAQAQKVTDPLEEAVKLSASADNPAEALQHASRLLESTPEEITSVVRAAGDNNQAIEAALRQRFKGFDEKFAAIQTAVQNSDDVPIGGLDIADPIRRAVFGDRLPTP